LPRSTAPASIITRVAVVGVAHDDIAAAGGGDAAAEGAAVALLGHRDDARAEPGGDGLRAVGAAVIGDDDLGRESVRFDGAAGLRMHASRVSASLRQGIRIVTSTASAGSTDRGGDVGMVSVIIGVAAGSFATHTLAATFLCAVLERCRRGSGWSWPCSAISDEMKVSVKTAIINMKLPSALSDLIMQCRVASGEIPSFADANAARLKVTTWIDPDPPTAEGERRRKAQKKAEELARRWFTDQNAKREVAELLRRFNLDEDALEATAIQRLFEELDKCERLLTGSELRRTRALAALAAYRSSGMARPRAPTDRTPNDRPARRLSNSSNENSAG